MDRALRSKPSSEEDAANSALIAVKNIFSGTDRKEILDAIATSASLTQLVRSLRLIKDTSLRTEAQTRLLEAAEVAVSVLNDQMVDLIDWVVEDPLIAGTRDEAVEMVSNEYGGVRAAAEKGRSSRNNKRGYLKKISTNWGSEAAESEFVQRVFQLPEGRLRTLADASAKEKNFKAAQERICAAYIDRLTTTRKGIRNSPDYMAADFSQAGDQALRMTAARQQSIQQLGLEVKGGWVVHKVGRGAALEAATSPPATRPRAETVLASPMPHHSRTQSTSSGPQSASDGAQSAGRPPSIGGALELRTRSQRHQSPTSPSLGGLGGPRESLLRSPEASPLSDFRASVLRSPPAQVVTNVLERQECACRPDKVSHTFIAIILLDQEKPSPERVQSALRELDQSGVEDEDGVFYCWPHTQDFGRLVGLRIHEGGHAQLLDRLRATAQRGGSLDAFKVSKEHYAWFRFDARGSVPADELGPYRFFPRSDRTGSNTIRRMTDNAVRIEVAKALGLAGLRDEWLKRGTINTTALFGWWEDKAISGAVSQEFDMYYWHLREINDKSNLGWQREQLFSLSQQLMRQDIGYWLAYSLLRDDNLMWLISYPYYTKNTRVGDNTMFRHIDLNINDMANGKGTNQIQGSLSLTTEDGSNCTIVVPGMHQHIQAWRDRLKARGTLGAGFIQKIDKTSLSPQDLKDFDTRWETVPCKKFGVRITRPEIPHGSTGPSKSERQTMLPWYVGIGRDHSGLEVEASGTYEQVAHSHRHQTAPPKSPSGYANMYGAIPYKFPAGVQLEGLGPISDALVGRKRWDDAEVQYEIVQLLMGRPAKEIRKSIEEWRKNATKKFAAAWEKEKKLEKFYFQGKAWGNRVKANPRHPSPDFARADAEMEEGEIGVELEGEI